MKNGDLIYMKGETLINGQEVPSVGIVVDDVPQNKRVGIMWVDGGGMIDYEPKSWLEVIQNAIPVEA